jgi:hypothetical protein
MVLPGIQALFGFQLIAVFSAPFAQLLPLQARRLHLAAIVLVAIAIALIMAPAAYHRQAERDRLTRFFANYASRLMTIAMAPLAAAIAIEVGLVAYAIELSTATAIALGGVLSLIFGTLWFAYPRLRRVRRSR